MLRVRTARELARHMFEAGSPVVVGLDVGGARVGVAAADARDGVAVPLAAVHAPRSGARGAPRVAAHAAAVADVVRGRRSLAVVAGVPLERDEAGDSTVGNQARRTLRFIQALSAELDDGAAAGEPPVGLLLVDEYGSTNAVRRARGEVSARLRKRLDVRDGSLDSFAAAGILGSAVDDLARHWALLEGRQQRG